MKKYKKLKISLIILGSLVLGVSIFLVYLLNFKEYDIADKEVDEIVADPYKIELPDDLIIESDEDVALDENEGETKTETADNGETLSTDGEQGVQTSAAKQEKVASAAKAGNESSPDKPTSATGQQDKPTATTGQQDKPKSTGATKTETSSTEKPNVTSIKSKYVPSFEKLQNQADAKLNSLVSHAKKEYSDKKAQGESVSYTYFYNKYMAAAKALESQTDSAFNSVNGAVEKELEAKGFNKSYAKSFTEDYEAKKKARRDSLLNKALGI